MTIIKHPLRYASIFSAVALATLTSACALQTGDEADTQSDSAELVTGDLPPTHGTINLNGGGFYDFPSSLRGALSQILAAVSTGPLYGSPQATIYNESQDHSFFRVFITHNGNNVSLVIRRNDMYVQGFMAQNGDYYYLSDSEFRLNGHNNVDLGFGGSYLALERASGRSRTEVSIGRQPMRTWVGSLAYPRAPTTTYENRAEAMMGFIITLAEATRFRSLADHIASGAGGSQTTRLTGEEGGELNQWRSLSGWVRAMLNNPAHQPNNFQFGNEHLFSLNEAAVYLNLASR
jgi:hypothetical protein